MKTKKPKFIPGDLVKPRENDSWLLKQLPSNRKVFIVESVVNNYENSSGQLVRLTGIKQDYYDSAYFKLVNRSKASKILFGEVNEKTASNSTIK